MTAKSRNFNCIYRQQRIESNTYICNRQTICTLEDCTNGPHKIHYQIINDHSKHVITDIPVTIITSYRKNPTINRTLRYLKNAGIKDISIRKDTQEHPLGIYGNWLAGAANSYFNHEQEYHIIMQDDVFVSRNFLTHCTPLLSDNVVISLFAPSAITNAMEPGWYNTENYGGGPNMLLMHKNVLELLITSKIALRHCKTYRQTNNKYEDLGIFKQLAQSKIPVYFHNPNFTMHWGLNSTHNPYQYSRMVFNEVAAGDYAASLDGLTYQTQSNAYSLYTPEFLISQYHEIGNFEYRFSTGLEGGNFCHDNQALIIKVKENDGPTSVVEKTDRIFWTR